MLQYDASLILFYSLRHHIEYIVHHSSSGRVLSFRRKAKEEFLRVNAESLNEITSTPNRNATPLSVLWRFSLPPSSVDLQTASKADFQAIAREVVLFLAGKIARLATLAPRNHTLALCLKKSLLWEVAYAKTKVFTGENWMHVSRTLHFKTLSKNNMQWKMSRAYSR